MTAQASMFDDAAEPVVHRGAALSDCGTYRYSLTRMWSPERPLGKVVMVNPSRGDANVDDPTLLNLMQRARAWGWGGFIVVNLFAYRSPDPHSLLTAIDPIGPANDKWILDVAEMEMGGQCVVAWGAAANFTDSAPSVLRYRASDVLKVLRRFGDTYCIGLTGDGYPKHPLARGVHRVPVETPLRLFAAKETR